MKSTLVRLTLAAAAAFLAACGHDRKPDQDANSGFNRYLQDPNTPAQPGDPADPNATAPATTPDPAVAPPKVDTPPPTTAGNPPTPPPPVNQYPYGKPVPGKKGFVTSPYDDKAGMIDVRDYTPGTKVRDPYTNKIFLVP